MSAYEKYKDCMKSNNSGDVGLWHDILKNSDRKEKAWVEKLRSQGFKAAHPDDGWVDDEKNIITMMYPKFNDGLGVGDTIMLGHYSYSPEKLRPVRIVAEVPRLYGSDKWKFEDIEVGE